MAIAINGKLHKLRKKVEESFFEFNKTQMYLRRVIQTT